MIAAALLALALVASPEPVVGEADVRPPAARRTPAEQRFLRARAALAAGDAEAAGRELPGLAAALPAIADRVHALEAAVAEARGQAGEAREAWARIPQGSLLWPQARLAVGRSLVAEGRGKEAVEAVRPLLGLGAPAESWQPDVAPRAILLAAKVLAAEPDGTAEARRLLVACWSRHALAPEAKECRARLDALPAPDGAPPEPEDRVRRAEVLLDGNRNEQALAEARQVGAELPAPGPDAPLSCRAAFVRGKAERKLRQYAAAAEELGKVVASCPDEALRPRALYLLSVATANVSNADGIRSYRRFAAEYPTHVQADDALFFAADLLVREGQVAEGRALLADLAERYPDGDFRAEAIFRDAWLARRQGNLDQAIAGMARIEAAFKGDPYEHSRALYWRGRFLAERKAGGDLRRAREAWEEVARLYPADYYGLLARARLAEAGRKQPEHHPGGAPRKGFRYRPGALAVDPHFREAVQLLRLDMDREATDELLAVDRSRLPAVSDTPEPLLLLVELLDRAGETRAAHRILRTQGRQTLREPPEGMGLRVWQMAYPPAWRELVVQYAPPAGVPPDLLQALMREESALDPAIVSAAGAVGLTQLMVRTAAQSARKLRLPTPSARDLTDPRLNIRLGAHVLGDLLARFGGSAPLALAAYNAGETNARAWWRARAALPLDEFVEEIPIQETRGYVKRVLRSYAAYRMLYGRAGERPVRLGQRLPPPPSSN